MKTSIKTLATICAVVISLSANAQKRSRGNEVQQPQQPQTQTNPDANERRVWASNNTHGGPNVSVHIGGGYPNYGGNYYGYNNYNNGYYNVKKAARNSLRQSASVIGQALQFSDWNDTYSPWLAKAIRHQQYAKQLYFWGDYAGALNHAERAGFLAWNTLSYFNNGYNMNGYGQNYPNPYSDPNNPYYRQSNQNTEAQPDNADEYGYRKTNPDNGSLKKSETVVPSENLRKTELDGTLPQSKLSDKELLKINTRDLDIE